MFNFNQPQKIGEYSWAIAFPGKKADGGIENTIGEIHAKKLVNGCFQIEILAVRRLYRKKGFARNLVKTLISEIDFTENDLQVSPKPYDYYLENGKMLSMEELCDIYYKLGFEPICETFMLGKTKRMIYTELTP